MLKWFLLSLSFLVYSFTWAQNQVSERESPSRVVKGEVHGVKIRIDYGSPSVKGREIWGKLVPWNIVWRTGANEATTIITNGDLLISGDLLKAGRYAIFTIPGEKDWILIFNKNADQWGAFQYDDQLDMLRIITKPIILDDPIENLEFEILNQQFIFRWEKCALQLSISKP